MNIFTFIKSRITIVEVVQEYVTLRKVGLYLKGRCPFHNERTGSFTVSPHREIFYCFGCHKGGDVIAFIAEMEHHTPLEAAKYLAEKYALTLPEPLLLEKSEANTQDFRRYTALYTHVALWFHQQLLRSPSAQEYLAQRGISSHMIHLFMIGYFKENSLPELLEHSKKEGYLSQDLLNTRIIHEGKFGLYCPFEERIIFPIKDYLGRTIGFGGRVFRSADSRAKYYNSPDQLYFTKGHILFGLDQAKKSIQEQQAAFLVEGYLDCIAMVQAGYTNTVATLGTACTSDHLRLLARYASKLYLVYDGDKAGQQAMIKLAQLSWAVNMELIVLSLPAGEDPASFLQKNTSLESIKTNAKDIFIFFIEQLGAGYQAKSLQERLALIQDFITHITLIDDPIKQNFLLQKAASTFDIAISVLLEASHKQNSNAPSLKLSSLDHEEHNNTREVQTPISLIEQKIFIGVINEPSLITPEDKKLIQKACSPAVYLLIEKFLIYITTKESEHHTSFLDTLTLTERQLAAQLLIKEEEFTHDAFKDVLLSLWKKEWKTIASEVKLRLKQAEEAQDSVAIARITHEFNEFKSKMKEKGIL